MLATHFGLAASFAANALLSTVTTALALWKLPETVGMHQSGERRSALPLREQVALLRSTPGFAAVGFVSFSLVFTRTGSLFNVVPLDAEQRLGLGPDQIGLALGFVSLLGLALAWPSGVLADRFGRKVVIVGPTMVAGAAMLLFGAATSWPAFAAAPAVWAAAVGIGGSVPTAYAADIAPRGMTAAALGAFRTLADVGYVAGPLALGIVAGAASPRAAYAAAAAMTTTAALVFARQAPETLGRPESGG